jgi:hypothetical protein
MKNILAVSLLFLLVHSAWAQQLTPAVIEQRLLKSYNRIRYWSQKQSDARYDSLEAANHHFQKLLLNYGRQYPFVMQQSFKSFENLTVTTSADGQLRIYTWDNESGGTMRFFSNVVQYKASGKVQTLMLPSQGEGDAGYYCSKIFTAVLKGKTYYLADCLSIGSSRDMGEAIKVFTIENNRLNTDAKIIKTQTGLHSQLFYSYDAFFLADGESKPSLRFDAKSNTIDIPLVDSKEKVTHRVISYKFTGQYFERVKS